MSVTVVEGDISASLAHQLIATGAVAVDTETSGLHWDRDRLELCQLFSPLTGPVMVRNVQGRPDRLAALLEDAAVVKVFHFAPFDLRFLEQHWEIRARRVECTKVASRLLDPQLPSAEHSLKEVLARHLGVEIRKGQVRTSDWGAAELSVEQVDYAVSDVRHLLGLADLLRGHLQTLGRIDLFAQICAYLPTDAHLAVSGFPNPLDY